ncbi:MAG: hypothetical protein BWX74_00310 [Tenericutes bacterium ADurb.Bin087]|nr:MAG: hypothetical protein BWX74_00310 [Tenericutes bacterium ADurb.Bin087]
MRRKKRLKTYAALTKEKAVTLSLPINYRQLFKFTYRTNLTLILKISIMLSLFAIPFLTALFFRGIITTGIANNTTAPQLAKNLMVFQGWYGFVILCAFLFFTVGLAGAINVMKKHLKNEGVIFLLDFKEGIRKNALSTLLLSLLYLGFLTTANYVLNLFYFESNFPFYAVFLVIFITLSVLIYMMWTIAIMIKQLYQCSFTMLLKSSFVITFAKLPYLLLSVLCSISPLIIAWIIGYVPLLFAILLLYIVIGFGNAILVSIIFNLYLFDELINKKQFPDRYREGLFSGEDIHPIDEGFHK